MLLAGAFLAACTRRSEAAPQGAVTKDGGTAGLVPTGSSAGVDGGASAAPVETEWDLGARGHAIVLQPQRVQARMPLVIALHGRGESLKGPVRGPWGWPRDYALTRAMTRLAAPPLTRADFEGFVTDERLARINESLRDKPFGGLVVVSPYLPDFDWSHPTSALVEEYGHFIVDEVIAKARRELPVIPTPAATGIDGVSLGGAMGLRVGFKLADQFGAIGSLQCAINTAQVDDLVTVARAARAKNPSLALRIATSDRDGFLSSNKALDATLTKMGVKHSYEEHIGPHDYPWNRGPGSYELLLFHDRSLARLG